MAVFISAVMGVFITLVIGIIIVIVVGRNLNNVDPDYNPTNAEEQYNLGCYYEEEVSKSFHRGNDVRELALRDQCIKKALYWYTIAAEQGHVSAQYELGRKYECGYRGDPSKRKARYWYTKAAEQGNEDAKKALVDLDRRFKEEHGGCYVATCVYGSYDCPEVWTLRRYRDSKLSNSWFGRRFIRIYYAVSPKIVTLFGNKKWFNGLCKPVLNKLVRALQNSDIDSSPYSDMVTPGNRY